MTLELNDMQGLLIRGFGNLLGAQYVLLRFTDMNLGKQYIKEMLPLITPATDKPTDHAVQMAFTYAGFSFLQLPDEGLASFSREFREGMTEDHRQFILGDSGENAPENWDWGNPAQADIHLLLIVYSKDADTLSEKLLFEKARADKYEVVEMHTLPSGLLQDHKEHFGFRDDISRPIIEELVENLEKKAGVTFPAGEFIMGYKNLYDEFAPAPYLPATLDQMNILPPSPDFADTKDFGKNGTYLVFRQMEQNVFSFWNYLQSQGKDKEDAICLASKMVGRWPDGSPLTLTPDKSDATLSTANTFGFWKEDKAGLKCPIGAHIRRTNPRDHLVTERTQKDSSEMAAKHRMLRKGRPYGKPVAESLQPEEMMELPWDDEKRGLHFLCLVTDIRRQFEFVQNNWVNFHKFGGQEHDADPIIGNHYKSERVTSDEYSIPEFPVKRKLKNIPNFTIVKGGSYFFFPGIRALTYLANHE